MRAAIYARKSTKDEKSKEEKSTKEENDDARSVPRQVKVARAFCASKAWTVDAAHIYEDEKKSGALFLGRPAFQRLMADAEAGAFDAVVFFDLDRFGRYTRKLMGALWALDELGVQVWDCEDERQYDFDKVEDEDRAYNDSRAADRFREKIRKHTRRAMRENAAAGLVVGCPPLGYRSVGEKGRKRLVIYEPEAVVVREIFARFATGEGYRSIAKALNVKGLLKPRAQQGRADGWSASTIRAVLYRELYWGEYVYGKTRKAYNRELRKVYRKTNREKGQIPTAEETWTRLDVPELAIVSSEIAERVRARRDDRKSRYQASLKENGGNGGRMPEKAHGKYLLSGGMLICPLCGGHFEARKHPWHGHPGDIYICSTRRRKPGVCENTLALPIGETDRSVLAVIEDEVLDPSYIDQLVAMVNGEGDNVAALASERDALVAERDRLVESIAKGVPAESIAEAIQDRDRQIRKLEARLREPREAPDRDKLRAALEQRTASWLEDLRGATNVARLVLRRLIGPITMHTEPAPPWVVRWRAQTKPDLIVGLAPSNWIASPTGFEPVSQP